MNNNAFSLTLFGVTVFSLSLDQIEGQLQLWLAVAVAYFTHNGYLSDTQGALALVVVMGWVHQFNKTNAPGLVESLVKMITHKSPPPSLPPGAVTALLLCTLCAFAVGSSGCSGIPAPTASQIQSDTQQITAILLKNDAAALPAVRVVKSILDDSLVATGIVPASTIQGLIDARLTKNEQQEIDPVLSLLLKYGYANLPAIDAGITAALPPGN